MCDSWIVLVYSLPATPSGRRVSIWKRLRRLGALSLKNSVYILPFNGELYERVQWLAQEIQASNGDVTLFRVRSIDNISRDEIIGRFQESRNKDFDELSGDCRELLDRLAKLPGDDPGEKIEKLGEAFGLLARRRKQIDEIDYFHAPGGSLAETLLADIAGRLEKLRARTSDESSSSFTKWSPAELKGKTWVTRPRPHIDRIGTAWLIRRFIDPGAVFVFTTGDAPEGAVAFDMAGADMSHHGENCTFETLLSVLDCPEKALRDIAEIVHEIDLKDGKFLRPEAPGIDALIRGVSARFDEDERVLQAGIDLFDSLYAFLASSLP